MPHDHDNHGDDPFHHEGMSPSGHPYRPDNDQKLSYWQRMEIAVRELLVEKGITTAAEINRQIELMDARSPALGAAVVARAWDDPAFRQRLLADGSAAMEDMGIDPDGLKLVVVENTDRVHNVVVCTLCSCYPRNLLGLPPDWYKSRARCSANSAWSCRRIRGCGCMIRPPTCATWCCRAGLKAPRAGTPRRWRRS